MENGVQHTRPSWERTLFHGIVELIIVFVGVYAAFLLNSYYDHRKGQDRRAQLLAWLAEDYQATSVDLDQEETSLRQSYDKFRADLAAGKMPPPTLLVGATSDYDPADKSQLLASGGTFELLDVAALRQLTVVEQDLARVSFSCATISS